MRILRTRTHKLSIDKKRVEIADVTASGEARVTDSVDLHMYLEDCQSFDSSVMCLLPGIPLRLASTLFHLGRFYEMSKARTPVAARPSRAAKQLAELRSALKVALERPTTPEGRAAFSRMRKWLNRKDLDPYCKMILVPSCEPNDFTELKAQLLQRPLNRAALIPVFRTLNEILKKQTRPTNLKRGRYAEDEVARTLVYSFARQFRELTGLDPFGKSRNYPGRTIFRKLLLTVAECLEPKLSVQQVDRLIKGMR